MTFSLALDSIKLGHKVARKGWNGKGMWIALHALELGDAMTHPYIYMFTAQGTRVPWLCSQTDMLAEDWEIEVDV